MSVDRKYGDRWLIGKFEWVGTLAYRVSVKFIVWRTFLTSGLAYHCVPFGAAGRLVLSLAPNFLCSLVYSARL